MRILYITPKINNEGGVARVLSIRTNYFIERFGYKISIITQNEGNEPLFYYFNDKIELFDIKLRKNRVLFLIDYIKQVSTIIKEVNPNVIIVTDNGLKGFLFPFIISTKIPIVFEVHGSKYNEELDFDKNSLNSFFHNLKYKIRNYGASKYSHFVALSTESAAEWNIKNTVIIPNPIEEKSISVSTLESKKVIFVGRHSHEKGLDLLLKVWNIFVNKHTDWKLEIYGKSDEGKKYIKLSKELKLENSTFFYEPIQNIYEKYLESSICVMTSRYEGFGMVLIEAMNYGLPIVAFDCPIGPRSIVTDNENGFLIEEGNVEAFVSKLELLALDTSLRKKMSENAQKTVLKYDLEDVMRQWELFFQTFR